MSISFATIVCNGEPSPDSVLIAYTRDSDTVIAVDAGIEQLVNLGITPDVFVGDMDSVSERIREAVQPPEIIEYPRDKSVSDAEIAVTIAIERGVQKSLLLSAAGKRMDHFYSNLAVVSKFPGRALLVDGSLTVFSLGELVRKCTISTEPGDLLSVFSFGSAVGGLTIRGAKWEVTGRTLYPGSLGLSNTATGKQVEISIETGTMFIFTESRFDQIEFDKTPAAT